MAVPEPRADAATVERRIVTVLFADLVGFTPLSERLDAEDVATVQDAYFAATRETVERYGGVLEKFIGDAAMAVFGAPRARDDDAERATRAGIALIGAVEQLGARLGLAPGELQLRVGVNSGEVVHATSGPDAGRVTGDTVNTAARLQAAARPGTVLVGELTALSVEETLELADAEPISLKGKTDAVRARAVVGPRPQPSRDAALGGLHAPLLGRSAELSTLKAAARGVVVVVAPPGVGKSRLLAAVETERVNEGRVLRARVRSQSLAPYEAVADLLRAAGAATRLEEALDSAGTDPARREVLVDEVAALLDSSTTGVTTARDVAAERQARFDAWNEVLAALSGRSSVTWIVEDVHWAGGDVLAFLADAAAAPGSPVIIASSRPSLLERAPDWIASASEVLHLEPLPPGVAGELIRALVGDALPDELVRAIVERSDGNPLFIEELIRTWASVGTLVGSDGGWTLAVPPDAVPLPPTVQAIYAAQLDDLPADARLVARRASVAGRQFADAALAPLDLADRRDGLAVLRRRDFLAGPTDDDMYAYRHALLRDAGYASLARQERARLHVALARWLTETSGERSGAVAEAIGMHYASAVESLPALSDDPALDRQELGAAAADWLERAAETALGLAAHDAAGELLRRSADLTPAAAPLERARRRLLRGEIMAQAAGLADGVVEMEAALAVFTGGLASGTDDAAALLARAAYRLGLAYMQQIRFPQAEELASETMRRLEERGYDEPAALSRLHGLHAWAVAAQGRDEGVLDEAAAAVELAAESGDPVAELEALDHRLTTADERDLAAPEGWAELAARALALGHWRLSVVSSRVHAIYLAMVDPRAGLPLIERSTELARTRGLTEQSGWGLLASAEVRFVIGDWDEAIAEAEQALALAERNAYLRLAFRTWMVILPMAAARHDAHLADRFDAWWARSAEEFPASPSPYAAILRAAMPLWLAAARGAAPAPAPDSVVEAWAPIGNPHILAAVELIGVSWARAGRFEPLRGLVDQAVANVASDDAPDPLMRSSAALMAAILADANGDSDGARHSAELALEHASAIGAAWWRARALRILGTVAEAHALERSLGIAE
jgi:class 3 adenylate cyclase